MIKIGFNASIEIKKESSFVRAMPVSVIKTIRSKNVSMCCAIANTGVMYFEINHRIYNKDSFLNLVNVIYNIYGRQWTEPTSYTRASVFIRKGVDRWISKFQLVSEAKYWNENRQSSNMPTLSEDDILDQYLLSDVRKTVPSMSNLQSTIAFLKSIAHDRLHAHLAMPPLNLGSSHWVLN
ncbi:hypothetical protein RF11_11261 [Thelohanellus kitauei]|uniref:Uncharacterized protein n=1 Tax=Thelohanellus kitauei TaxID=669202 RepID=A0A0C2MHM8_THEKT|nr:hypothetical protein RF11_11261 [Thelohanellus kitauei]